MDKPLQIVSKEFSLPEWADAMIRERAEELEKHHPHIVGCDVRVDGPGPHHRQGEFQVSLVAKIPGKQLVVNHKHDDDLGQAIGLAFDAMTRRLDDDITTRRGR